jgi:spoIIIJ-associated protein
MIKVCAKTLEEAYLKACRELNASIIDIHFEVLQNHCVGFCGFFKKEAIVLAERKPDRENKKSKDKTKQNKKSKKNREDREYQSFSSSCDDAVSKPKSEPKNFCTNRKEDSIFDNFYKDSSDDKCDFDKPVIKSDKPVIKSDKPIIKNDKANSDVVKKISDKLNLLFSKSCYEIDTINVSMYDDTTVCIMIDGDDSSLLIGKSAKRYKALSYMLFNWIKMEYNLFVRLEISKFLESQEENIKCYIDTLHDKIEEQGYGKTKILDGVLVYIATKELKRRFPDKYIGVRENEYGKYIIINEFRK